MVDSLWLPRWLPPSSRPLADGTAAVHRAAHKGSVQPVCTTNGDAARVSPYPRYQARARFKPGRQREGPAGVSAPRRAPRPVPFPATALRRLGKRAVALPRPSGCRHWALATARTSGNGNPAAFRGAAPCLPGIALPSREGPRVHDQPGRGLTARRSKRRATAPSPRYVLRSTGRGTATSRGGTSSPTVQVETTIKSVNTQRQAAAVMLTGGGALHWGKALGMAGFAPTKPSSAKPKPTVW